MINARNLIAALALAPLAAVAAMSDGEATRAVQDALAGGQSADSIIQMLRDDGRTLDAATMLAVAAASVENQPALAKAGICAATDSTEAERIAADLLTELSGDMVDTVESLVASYDTGGCDDDDEDLRPPPSYAPTDTSHGGGTRPGGGLLPPGSPAS
ncbi:hypothetical protein F0M18_17265 [Pseudohalioglobus sediminis]|uniref:Uncharacterized protein n=1 Tax=Pseudohalioglobus sediminis TaxID=2606449 RepID=A0A5B0WPK8_9GAMM|nr:hypothetical protein [Pseudohalioglobus sediminis]KAA1188952.1 hypothetical protein F0M18_17265 [Pseudohalioglobus sediminis]